MPGSIAGNGSATVNALVTLCHFSGEWMWGLGGGRVGGGGGPPKLIRGELNSACSSLVDLVVILLHVVILTVVPILLAVDLVVNLLHIIHCCS